jgi:hypothetical protein
MTGTDHEAGAVIVLVAGHREIRIGSINPDRQGLSTRLPAPS